MRAYGLAIAIAAVCLTVPVSAGAAGRCEELRLACEHKDALSELGVGNCKKYRACLAAVTSRRVWHRQSCSDMRRACLHKDALGELGVGNCKKYREMCRS
jgi:hypothetical protein